MINYNENSIKIYCNEFNTWCLSFCQLPFFPRYHVGVTSNIRDSSGTNKILQCRPISKRVSTLLPVDQGTACHNNSTFCMFLLQSFLPVRVSTLISRSETSGQRQPLIVRPPLNKMLFPVHRPSGLKKSRLELIFSWFLKKSLFSPSIFSVHSSQWKMKNRKKNPNSWLALFLPTRWTGNYLPSRGGLKRPQ